VISLHNFGTVPEKANVVFVEGAVFESGNGDPKNFDIEPNGPGQGQGNPQNVDGTPDKGEVV
jgi:hypothetical protein